MPRSLSNVGGNLFDERGDATIMEKVRKQLTDTEESNQLRPLDFVDTNEVGKYCATVEYAQIGHRTYLESSINRVVLGAIQGQVPAYLAWQCACSASPRTSEEQRVVL